MREFQTVEELWQYCLFCPLCKEPSRTITITAGPDDNFKLSQYEKIGPELKLYCKYRSDDKYKYNKFASGATITVDCNSNEYTLEIAGDATHNQNIYFFCYLHSKCNGCGFSYLNTSDLEFDDSNKHISNIKIDQEAVFFLSAEEKYHISVCHDSNIIMVSRCEDMGDAMIDDPNIIELPLVNLDLSDRAKVVSKIKTLILFS